MRRRRRTLRELFAEARMTPEERADLCAERCMGALYDEDGGGMRAWEREEAALEAERRRWTTPRPPADPAS
jgi:hypothetical protein